MPNATKKPHISPVRKMTLLCAVMFASISFTSIFYGQSVPMETSNHDGTWWQEKSEPLRAGFVIGYLTASRDAHINGISAKTAIDYKSAMIWVMGLNKFYEDFRNRTIYVGDALQYVKFELSGASDKQLTAQLLHLRQTVRPTKDPE